MRLPVLLICLALGLVNCLEVELEGLGKVKSKTEVSRDGVEYESFLGIPFAEPPTGENRFKRPIPVKEWSGVKDATNYGSKCPQFYPFHHEDGLGGSEDCLFLNVHTKSLIGKKPVIVYLHGGAFISGHANQGAKYMLEQDVVFVSLQYRLGVFGLLSTEDSVASGNWGLYDQQLALKWIKEHISKFGGNPDLVTLMGMSAGAASVHYHMLSPNSDGLFHRAMAISGSALCWWANLPKQRKTAIDLAIKLDCPSTTESMEVLECLRGKSMEEIMLAESKLYSWRQGQTEAEPMNIWSPRPDVEAGDLGILPVNPTLAMQAGQIQPVPFVVGVAESEGAWRAAGYLYKEENMGELIKNFDRIAPLALGLKDQIREDEMVHMLHKIKHFYLNALVDEEDLDKRQHKTIGGLIHMLGDTMFNYPIDQMVKLHGNKEHSPVWMYEFNYKHNHSIASFDSNDKVRPIETQQDQLRKPTHAHEVSMLFPQFEEDMGPLSADETKMSKKFVKFVYDFAVHGNPNQDNSYEMRDWKNIEDGHLSYHVFGKSVTHMGLPFQQRMEWWSHQPVWWNKSKPDGEEHYEAEVDELTDQELKEHDEELDEMEVEILKDEL